MKNKKHIRFGHTLFAIINNFRKQGKRANVDTINNEPIKTNKYKDITKEFLKERINELAIQGTEAVARRCSLNRVFLNISHNSQENTCVGVSFLMKLQAWGESKEAYETCIDSNVPKIEDRKPLTLNILQFNIWT